MITKDNLKWAFDTLTQDEVTSAMESNDDYVALEMHTSNVGSYATLRSVDPDEQDEIESNGNLFMDKDNLLRMFVESESVNPYLIEWI